MFAFGPLTVIPYSVYAISVVSLMLILFLRRKKVSARLLAVSQIILAVPLIVLALIMSAYGVGIIKMQ